MIKFLYSVTKWPDDENNCRRSYYPWYFDIRFLGLSSSPERMGVMQVFIASLRENLDLHHPIWMELVTWNWWNLESDRFESAFQCFFRLKRNNFQIFSFQRFFLVDLKKFDAFSRLFSQKPMKNKGKIILETQNTENVRLRRAKICIKTSQFWLKSRP